MSKNEPSANPRADALAALYEHAAALAKADDVAAARVVHEAIGKLLADVGADAGAGKIIDLGARRRER